MATVGETLHESARPAHPPTVPKWVNVAGWVVTILVTVAFAMSGIMKLKGGEEMAKGMADAGLSPGILVPLGVFELVCLLLYLAPATSVLGAILFTGYLGGACVAHLHMHQTFEAPVIVGLLVWLGVFFRDYRLRQLIPIRQGRSRS